MVLIMHLFEHHKHTWVLVTVFWAFVLTFKDYLFSASYKLQILIDIFWDGHVNFWLICHENSHNLISLLTFTVKHSGVLPFLFRKSCSLLLFNSIKWIFVYFILTLFVNSDCGMFRVLF